MHELSVISIKNYYWYIAVKWISLQMNDSRNLFNKRKSNRNYSNYSVAYFHDKLNQSLMNEIFNLLYFS